MYQHDFILLDRSGSMRDKWQETLSSVNAYVHQLAKDNVDTGVTLATFDDHAGLQFDTVRDRIIPSTWRNVTEDETYPRGSTPLNDAIGRIVALAHAGNYDKVAIIIMTDGHENASRELSVQAAKDLLKACTDRGWQVVWLGANYDNAQQATTYGAMKGQHVASTVVNLAGTMSAMANKRNLYATRGTSMNFTDEEKEKAKS